MKNTKIKIKCVGGGTNLRYLLCLISNTMPQLEQSSLQPSTHLQHRHLLQTTSYNHLLRLHLLISRKRNHKQQQARTPPPPLDGGLRSQKGLRPFNPLQRIGRLTQKTGVLGENEVYPIYVPNKCYFGELLIRYYHNKLLHSGTAHALSRLRNEFWIPKGRRMVRSVIMKCYNCRRFQGGPFKMPDMMTWPAKKVTRSPPFTYTGLDYLGPLYVKSKKGKKKVWLSLFTCIVVRAIHLEIVSVMSADSFY